MTTRSNKPLREVLGCPGRMSGPSNLIASARLVLDEIGPAWRSRLALAGVPAPRHIAIGLHPSVGGSDVASGVTSKTGSGHVIRLTISDPAPLTRLRHCLPHELGHVLLDEVDPGSRKWLAGEYAAERIGWEIVRAAGLRPHDNVFVSSDREDQRRWLRPLVAVVNALRSASAEERRHPDDGRYGRDLGRLITAATSLARAEAYRRGQADAGIAVDEPVMPHGLAAALDDLFAPISEHPLPASADAQDLREFLDSTVTALFDRHADFARHVLEDLTVTDASEFIAFAPPRAA
jgi:hypothetical protein